MSDGQKIVFLDRDGTLNVDRGYVHRIEDWQWTEQAIQALKKLQEAGFLLAVVTNQSAIAEGSYTVEDMESLHEHMQQELAEQGVTLAAIAFCSHSREGDCDCRKPNIGMARQIEEHVGPLNYANSWTIGDKIADMLFGKKAGTHTALIRSQYWKEEELTEKPDTIVENLFQAADFITRS